MKYIVERFRRFCGFITGFVFFISGIFKLMDPVGAGLVMDEYFNFLHISFLDFAAKPLATVFALFEAVVGAALITGVWRKLTAIVVMAFQAFFTLLTLALVIFNPEMDCGCFGEAIHLSHLETFLKNIVLCFMLAIAFIPLRGLGRPKKRKFVSFAIVVASVVAFTVYSWIYIPLIDYTDYKVSAVLASADKIMEHTYEARFIYEKDGEQKAFTLEEIPDSSWTFVSTETVRTSAVKEPAILSFTDSYGEYRDELAAEGKVIVISIYDPEMKPKKWDRIREFAANIEKEGIRPLILAAGTPGSLDDTMTGIYYSDYKTLVTLNRSNGGATFISDGHIVGKKAYKNLPDAEELAKLVDMDEVELTADTDTKGSLAFQGFLLYVFAVMLLL